MSRLTLPSHLVVQAVLLASLVLIAAAQREGRTEISDTAAAPSSGTDRPVEVAFDLRNNHIVLPVSINGSPSFWVALDTGFPAPGVALYDGPRVASLGLAIDPAMQGAAGGAGGSGERFSVKVAPDESFEVGGARFSRTPVIVLPDLGIGGYHDGIIGFSLFSRFVVELDFESRVMRLHKPKLYEQPADALEVPLRFRNGAPYTSVRVTPLVGAPVDTEVHVDLGASHAISLYTEGIKGLKIPSGSPAAVVGRGISGVLRGHVGRIAELEIAGVSLEGVVTSFPGVEHQNPRKIPDLGGNLGVGVLKRFTTVLDYANDRMLLTPNASVHDEFRFDRSGLRLAPGARLEVEGVIASSPAEQAGIRTGDVLQQIDGQAVTGSDYGRVRTRLLGTGEVDVVFSRGSTSSDATLSLRDLLPATAPFNLEAGQPLVLVRVNGKGPFPFILDTAAAGVLLTESLSNELGLETMSHPALGSASGGADADAPVVVRLDSLSLAGQSVHDVQASILPPLAETSSLGAIAPSVFRELGAMTMDFESHTVTLGGAVQKTEVGSWIPLAADTPTFKVPIELGALSAEAHIDTGSPAGLAIPSSLENHLEVAGPIRVVGRARTLDGEFDVRLAPLDVTPLRIAGVEVPVAYVLLGELPGAIVGTALLAGHALHVDWTNDRFIIRRVEPAS